MVIFNSEKWKNEKPCRFWERTAIYTTVYVSLLKIWGLQLLRLCHIGHELLGLAKKSDAYWTFVQIIQYEYYVLP